MMKFTLELIQSYAHVAASLHSLFYSKTLIGSLQACTYQSWDMLPQNVSIVHRIVVSTVSSHSNKFTYLLLSSGLERASTCRFGIIASLSAVDSKLWPFHYLSIVYMAVNTLSPVTYTSAFTIEYRLPNSSQRILIPIPISVTSLDKFSNVTCLH